MSSNHPAIPMLAQLKTHIWNEVQPYLKDPSYPAQFMVPAKYQPEADFHWTMSSDYPKRQGKYIRGSLVVLIAEAMGVPAENAYKTAAAMQISEDWILIHDDFEDNSPTRRGQPALHHIYGDKLAVNAGDALHALMWKILVDNQTLLGESLTIRLIDEFYTMIAHTALGQTVEMKWTQDNRVTDDSDWYFIADSKTGYYSLAGPMRFGGIIGNASETQLKLLTDLGLNLGRCFQLVDDTLDLTGNFAGLKSQSGDDIYEGKRTIPLGHLLRTVSKSDSDKIISILAKPREQKTSSEVTWILDQMHQHGSITYAQNLATQYRDAALKIIDTKLTFLKHEPALSNLKTISDFILNRSY